MLDVFQYESTASVGGAEDAKRAAATATSDSVTATEAACSPHVDSGLLTLIPTQCGSAGLELLDWAVADFVLVEHATSPSTPTPSSGGSGGAAAEQQPFECVIFGGQQLSYLTGGYLQATVHKVSRPSSGHRLSTPLQLLANPDRELDPRVTIDKIVTRAEAAAKAHKNSSGDAKSKDSQLPPPVPFVRPTQTGLAPCSANGFVLSILKRSESVTFGYQLKQLAEDSLLALK